MDKCSQRGSDHVASITRAVPTIALMTYHATTLSCAVAVARLRVVLNYTACSTLCFFLLSWTITVRLISRTQVHRVI